MWQKEMPDAVARPFECCRGFRVGNWITLDHGDATARACERQCSREPRRPRAEHDDLHENIILYASVEATGCATGEVQTRASVE